MIFKIFVAAENKNMNSTFLPYTLTFDLKISWQPQLNLKLSKNQIGKGKTERYNNNGQDIKDLSEQNKRSQLAHHDKLVAKLLKSGLQNELLIFDIIFDIHN